MTKNINSKQYDLEGRTFLFAHKCRAFYKRLPKTIGNYEDGKQLVRSSGSVGANYIEANGSLSKKDFILRLKISRKEAKESKFWLRLIDTNDDKLIEQEQKILIQEATELTNILSAIIRNSE